MHDFGVAFQKWSNPRIYRGLGKSEIPFVFLNVPYGSDTEIGGTDGPFDPEFPDFLGKCHPPVSESAIFYDF